MQYCKSPAFEYSIEALAASEAAELFDVLTAKLVVGVLDSMTVSV